jgi:hypothetical protein
LETPALRAMSFMLAASKPWVRNTARAPSMIWRRLALSSVAVCMVNTIDIAPSFSWEMPGFSGPKFPLTFL